MPKITFKITNKREIYEQILAEMRKIVVPIIKELAPKILESFKSLILEDLRSDPAYNSLVSGPLQTELGVSSFDAADNLIEAWADSFTFLVKSSSSKKSRLILTLEFGWDAGENLEKLTSLPSSSYTYFSKTFLANVLIPWAEWLLTFGNGEPVIGYKIVFNRPDSSRTGDAIMVKSRSTNWSVPSQYAGTEQDNILTRRLNEVTLDRLKDEIESQFKSAF